MKDKVYKYLKILFDEGEHTCVGNLYETSVTNPFESSGEESFISINPLDSKVDHSDSKGSFGKPRRADMNVSVYRSFLFEIDTLPLDDQMKLLKECGIPWSAIVYSGSKSYHALLCLDEPLPFAPHNMHSILEYKTVWKRLCAHIQEFAKDQGYENYDTVIDPSSKNPSRFTRFPESIRKGKDTFQSIEYLGVRVDRESFYKVLNACPEIETKTESNIDVIDSFTRGEFFQNAPIALVRKLKYAPFADCHGMYPLIFQLTMWAIDSTNVPKDVLMNIMEESTFPMIEERGGYDNSKRHLHLAVDHAYRSKGYL